MSIIIDVERDSVCMADDCDAPHRKKFSFSDAATIGDAITIMMNYGYLAAISDGKATWTVEFGRTIAVIAQQWTAARLYINKETPLVNCIIPDRTNAFHFRYWGQIDPEEIHERFKNESLKSGPSFSSMFGI